MRDHAVGHAVDEHGGGVDGPRRPHALDRLLGESSLDESALEVVCGSLAVDGDHRALFLALHEPFHQPLQAVTHGLLADELDVDVLAGHYSNGQADERSIGGNANAVGQLVPAIWRIRLQFLPLLRSDERLRGSLAGPPPQPLVREALGRVALALGLNRVAADEDAVRGVRPLPEGLVVHIGHLPSVSCGPLGPCGLRRPPAERVVAYLLEHQAVVLVLRRRAVVDDLRAALRLGRRNGVLERFEAALVQALRLVEDQQRAVLAVTAISGACQELHDRAVLQADLLASQRRADAVRREVLGQPAALEHARHLREGLGGGLLQLAGVEHAAAVEEHLRGRASLDGPGLAVLARGLVAGVLCRPPPVGAVAHPGFEQDGLPVHQFEAAFAQQVDCVVAVVARELGNHHRGGQLVTCGVG